MVRRANHAKSVLKRQKPKARSQARSLHRGLLGLLVVGSSAIGAYVWLAPDAPMSAPNLLSTKHPTRRRNAQDPWRIDIKNDGSQPLEDQVIIKIRSTILEDVASSSTDLQPIAHSIRKMGSFTSVRITQSAYRSLVVQVTPRVPLLCLDADQLRFVDTLGFVYGSPSSLEECPGPPIKGLFDISHKHALNDDATLELTSGEQPAIQDALLLQKSLASHQLQATSMAFTKHRGFTITLKGKSPEITLGYPPFDSRLDKLLSLLDKLASKGDEASRIELDYQGKAFFKLKKM